MEKKMDNEMEAGGIWGLLFSVWGSGLLVCGASCL